MTEATPLEKSATWSLICLAKSNDCIRKELKHTSTVKNSTLAMDLLLNKQVLQIPMPLLVRHLLAVQAMGVTLLGAEVWRHQHSANLLNLTTKVLALNHRVPTSNNSVEVQVSDLAVGKSTLLMEGSTEVIMATKWAVEVRWAYSPWVAVDPAISPRPRRTTSQTR